MLDGPFLHDSGNRIRDVELKVCAILNGLVNSLVDVLREALAHDCVIEHETPVNFRN